MKFMRLGSKPDAFQADGDNSRYVASELPSDIVIIVGEVKFYLHKFPLLSKSNRLQKLIQSANEDNSDEVRMVDFPGGPKAFEICAKFCYGITITLNSYNVVSSRCAAEYLEMTEDIDRGNLIFRIEVFLSSIIFHSWKDSIIVLQSTKTLLPWSEDLKVVGRCVDSIASKASVDPSNVSWSYTYNRKLAVTDQICETGERLHQKSQCAPKDWWVEDICELDIDLYTRVMVTARSKGTMSTDVIGEALRAYAIRWLPESIDYLVSPDCIQKNRTLVETIIWLLPSNRVCERFYSFLLKLLKVVILVGAGDAPKDDLLKRISWQLDEATVSDLLILAQAPDTTIYDVKLVQDIVNRFVKQASHTQDSDKEKVTDDFVLGKDSWLNVGKLVDGYLTKIACDPNLPVSSFIDLSQLIPESARPLHDGLYKAIDSYLKEHPNLTKVDKKRICSLMDVKKLSMEACMHAAQNECLPLRVVVQVLCAKFLFFEHIRVSTGGLNTPQNFSTEITHFSAKTLEEWETMTPDNSNRQMSPLKIHDEQHWDIQENKQKKGSKHKGAGVVLRSGSRKIFEKFWVGSKGHGENGSSAKPGSSRKPTSPNPGKTRSFSTPRNARHSVS